MMSRLCRKNYNLDSYIQSLYSFYHLYAIQLWDANIQNNNIRLIFFSSNDGIDTIIYLSNNMMTILFQQNINCHSYRRVIINY
ncbi:hypothetical protein DEU50_110126 [Aeromonas salmonicida]|uniref:Uncharacterized protein n=1 Tax=Aeromonas salmonicida TaxID=645 RepID=A0AAX1PHB4_AERSA|nr:hypothetical protein DEU50_110126 [Aeromonas salmonicida]